MWISTQNHPQGAGISWAHLFLSSSCFVQWFLAGGFCSLCLSLGMDLPGTAISLWKGMFRPRLGIHFGLFSVITRCLDWCLLGKWIRRSRGLERGLYCRPFNCKFFYAVQKYTSFQSVFCSQVCNWLIVYLKMIFQLRK